MIELGTKAYPYRSFRAVSSEILNQFSYLQVNITIYLKEGIKVYVEDDVSYFLNMESVSITSYSDTSPTPGKALLVPTSIGQYGISERAAFHILNHTDLPIEEKIGLKSYGDSELAKLRTNSVTFKISETSFSFTNIDSYREEVDYNGESFLFYPIYLQNRDIVISMFFSNFSSIFAILILFRKCRIQHYWNHSVLYRSNELLRREHLAWLL
jgi:hypothetical protein